MRVTMGMWAEGEETRSRKEGPLASETYHVEFCSRFGATKNHRGGSHIGQRAAARQRRIRWGILPSPTTTVKPRLHLPHIREWTKREPRECNQWWPLRERTGLNQAIDREASGYADREARSPPQNTTSRCDCCSGLRAQKHA
jgi:hypothetical protein